MYDPTQAIGKMLGGMGNPHPYAHTKVNTNPESQMNIGSILSKLGEIKLTAQQAHQRSGGKINYQPLIKKLLEAEAIGHALQRKASSGRI